MTGVPSHDRLRLQCFPAALGLIHFGAGIAVDAGDFVTNGRIVAAGNVHSTQGDIRAETGNVFAAGNIQAAGNVLVGSQLQAPYLSASQSVTASVYIQSLGHIQAQTYVHSLGTISGAGSITSQAGDLVAANQVRAPFVIASQSVTATVYLQSLGHIQAQTYIASLGSIRAETNITTTGGRLGVGTAAPDRPLHVIGAGYVTGLLSVGQINTAGDHFRVVNNGAAEATTLSVRPWNGVGTGTIYAAGNVEAGANITAGGSITTLGGTVTGGTVVSNGQIKAGSRVIADGQGCRYA